MHIVKRTEVMGKLAPGAAAFELLTRESSATSLALWRIAAGETTRAHRHDETEVLLMVEGSGVLSVAQQSYELSAGDVCILEPFEAHSLTNRGAKELAYLSVYWRDGAAAVQRLVEQRAMKDDPVFVTSTPPTPNGDLHLGHLSGPYLGADVHTRFLKMTGLQAFHITGSDDFQSYVVAKATHGARTPLETAVDFAGRIKLTLAALDIRVDCFYEPRADGEYQALQQQFLRSLLEKECVYPATMAATFDQGSGKYAYEVDIRGTCSVCGSPSGGNICEECGHPNQCVDLVGAVSSSSQSTPQTLAVRRLHFKLSKYVDAVKRHHQTAAMAPRLRELLGQLLRRGVVDPAVTHPGAWGISADSIGDCSDQTIWAWFEMAGGLLYAISRVDPNADTPAMSLPKRGRIVHFFGFDNSFYHTVLFPAIYAAAFAKDDLPINYCYNEFLLLDQQKFSTSRNHAIWGREILESVSSDVVRFALAYERPESMRTNFNRSGMLELAKGTLIDQWTDWLGELHRAVQVHCNGRIPDAGLWSPAHMEFLGRLSEYPARLARAYGAEAYSLRSVARDLIALVQDVREFALHQKHWGSEVQFEAERRTALALQLATARLLAQLAAPLMPKFAQSLWGGLGQFGAVESSGWPDRATICSPGTPVRLDLEYFTVVS